MTEVSTLVRTLLLSSPNFKIHPLRASEFVPHGPELPDMVLVTNSTAPSLMIMVIKIGVLLYVFNVEQKGIFLCGCFSSMTDTTFSLIRPV